VHTKTKKDVEKQAYLQEEILEHIVSFLAPSGVLVYATCSLAKLEGESQIKHFIKAHPDWQILPISFPKLKNSVTKEGFLRVLPQHFKQFGGIDGFFVALLQRKI
jgi:16S rRNA (cytosine967-C5)-methyltransferase